MKKQFTLVVITLFLLTHFSVDSFSQDSTNSLQTSATDTIMKTADTNKCAFLYIYRLRSFAGSAISYNIHLNDSVICRIKNDTKYIIKLFKEGPVQLWAETEQKDKINLDVHFGQEYFLKCGIKPGIMVGRPELSMQASEQGRLDFENLNAKNTRSK